MIGFRKFHPITNFSFFTFVLLVSLILNHPLIIAISFIIGLIYDLHLRGKKSLKTLIFFLIPTMILIVSINFAFSHHGVSVIYTSDSGVMYTLESLATGMINAFKFACALLWFSCMSMIMDEEKTLFLFGRLSPKIALVVSMSLRFIPLMSMQYEQISIAQKGIGKTSGDKIMKKIKAAINNISILITWQLEKAIETANSMTARGYGLKGKTRYNKFSFSKHDVLFLVLCLVCLSAIVFAVSTSSLYASYTPVLMIEKINLNSVIATIFWAVTLGSPIIIDYGERKNGRI